MTTHRTPRPSPRTFTARGPHTARRFEFGRQGDPASPADGHSCYLALRQPSSQHYEAAPTGACVTSWAQPADGDTPPFQTTDTDIFVPRLRHRIPRPSSGTFTARHPHTARRFEFGHQGDPTSLAAGTPAPLLRGCQPLSTTTRYPQERAQRPGLRELTGTHRHRRQRTLMYSFHGFETLDTVVALVAHPEQT